MTDRYSDLGQGTERSTGAVINMPPTKSEKWQAVPISRDCSAARSTQKAAYSGCLYRTGNGAMPLKGYPDIVYVSTLDRMVNKYYYDEKEPLSVSTIDQLVVPVTVSAPSSFVYATASARYPLHDPYDGSVTELTENVLTQGGVVFGSQELAAWPAFTNIVG